MLMTMRRGETLSERVTAHLQAFAERRGFRTALAKRLQLSQSAISPYVSGERPVTLAMVEAISEAANVPIAELVAPADTEIKQLDADEAALLRWLRLWPKDVTRHLGRFVQFFADEAPAVQQQRNFHEMYRNLGTKDREWLYGVSVMLREGTLPPDLQAGLVQELEAEQYRRQATKRQRKA